MCWLSTSTFRLSRQIMMLSFNPAERERRKGKGVVVRNESTEAAFAFQTVQSSHSGGLREGGTFDPAAAAALRRLPDDQMFALR